MSDFRLDPLLFFEDDEFDRARASIELYQRSYAGGAFDRWVATTDPCRISATDLLAVTTLSVRIAAEAAIWILEDGAERPRGIMLRSA